MFFLDLLSNILGWVYADSFRGRTFFFKKLLFCCRSAARGPVRLVKQPQSPQLPVTERRAAIRVVQAITVRSLVYAVSAA